MPRRACVCFISRNSFTNPCIAVQNEVARIVIIFLRYRSRLMPTPKPWIISSLSCLPADEEGESSPRRLISTPYPVFLGSYASQVVDLGAISISIYITVLLSEQPCAIRPSVLSHLPVSFVIRRPSGIENWA